MQLRLIVVLQRSVEFKSKCRCCSTVEQTLLRRFTLTRCRNPFYPLMLRRPSLQLHRHLGCFGPGTPDLHPETSPLLRIRRQHRVAGIPPVVFFRVPVRRAAMAEHLSQSELDYPFKLLEYFNGFRVSKVTL